MRTIVTIAAWVYICETLNFSDSFPFSLVCFFAVTISVYGDIIQHFRDLDYYREPKRRKR